MPRNIVLVGLPYDTNLGDQAIFDVTHAMLEEIFAEKDLFDVDIRPMDMTGRVEIGVNATEAYVKKNFCFRAYRDFYRKVGKKLGFMDPGDLLAIESARIRCRQVFDNNTCAVIFAGGGIIKYKYQRFHSYIASILRYADRRNIPVMLSAVGVEGYSKTDRKCQLLKRALTRRCVKMISTRDDIDTLKNYFCPKLTDIVRVADPACSINVFFPACRSETSNRKTIGLGFVREKLFTDNGLPFDKEKMLLLWKEIYELLMSKGYDVKLFCNGAKSDHAMILDWMEYMGFSDNVKAELCFTRPESSGELINIISGLDGIISCRLHTSILAYSYSVPFVSLVWNDKQIFFGECISHPERIICLNDFDAKLIVDRLESALSQADTVQPCEAYCGTTKEYLCEFVSRYILNQ